MKAIQYFLVICVITIFVSPSVFAAEPDSVMVEKSSFDIRVYNLRSGSIKPKLFWETKDGVETVNNGSKKDPGFRVTFVARFDNDDKIWGIPVHGQLRLSYQRFQVENSFWQFRHSSEYGPVDQKFFSEDIRHDSISIQPFIGMDIASGDYWSLRIFIPPVPSLAIEKNNNTYNVASSMSSFAELCFWNVFLEAGYGFRFPLTFRENKDLTTDHGWYFGVVYKTVNL